MAETDLRDERAAVAVIGAGLAGVSAALAAASILSNHSEDIILYTSDNIKGNAIALPPRVLVFDACKLGGNSARASSGISCAGTPAQESLRGISDYQKIPEWDKLVNGDGDSAELHAMDTARVGGGLGRAELVATLTGGGREAWLWIRDELGLELDQVNLTGGHSIPRTHRCSLPAVGFQIMSAARRRLTGESSRVHLYEEERVEEVEPVEMFVCRSDGKMAPIIVLQLRTSSGRTVTVRSAVFCTGGFAGSPDELAKRAPQLQTHETTNGSHANGHGLKILEKLGAHIVDAEKVQVHPTGFKDGREGQVGPHILAPECLRGVGGCLLDPQTGLRFVDELAQRAAVASMILNKTSTGQALFVVPRDAAAVALGGEHAVDFYLGKGALTASPNCTDADVAWNLPQGSVVAGLKQCHSSLSTVSQSTAVLGGLIVPCVHYCMGGAAILPTGRVITAGTGVSQTGSIPVWAAGEVTGGIHGSDRLAGNSLLECVVFGRISGTNAAKFALE